MSKPGLFIGLAMGAASLMLAAPASAEPACADPALLTAELAPRPSRALYTFEAGGAAFSLSARGRSAALDTSLAREHLEDARAFGAVLPGYPQPAQMTLDIRMWF
jgi:hypothetical protein